MAEYQYISAVEIQGQHSYIPPKDEIAQVVDRWVARLIAAIVPPMEFEGTLQIECRRVPAAKGFEGVFPMSFSEFSRSSLEIRVRPTNSLYQWPCHLSCPNKEVAMELFLLARPKAAEYMAWHQVGLEQSLIEKPSLAPLLPQNRRAKRRQQKDMIAEREKQRVLKGLGKRSVLGELCHMIAGDISSQEGATVAESLIQQKVAQLFRLPLINVWDKVLPVLVVKGLFEPANPEDPNGPYLPTVAFHEYVYSHRVRMMIERIEREKQGLDTAIKLKEAADRDVARARQRLDQEEQKATSLEERVASTRASLEELERTFQQEFPEWDLPES